jgi:hypothetical protein
MPIPQDSVNARNDQEGIDSIKRDIGALCRLIKGPASDVSIEADRGFAATNVQDALVELNEGKQPLDADLTSVGGLETNGLIARTGAGAFVTRTLVGPAAGLTVTNGGGVAGDPTLALADDLAALEGLTGTGGWAKRTAANTWTISIPTAADVGADPAGTATAAVATHVGLSDPHTQYRLESVSVPWSDLSGVPSTFTPASHAASHASAGGDPVTLAQSQITNLVSDLAAKAPIASPALTGNPTAPTPATGDNDTSIATTAFVNAEIANDVPALATAAVTTHVALSDPHTQYRLESAAVPWADLSGVPATFAPSTHASSHQSGGGDAIKLDDLATPDDNTDLNASTTRHGLLRKLSNVATEYMDGTGNWSTPAGSSLTLSADREVDAAKPPASSDSRLRGPFGLINYCKNPNAEIDTSGWATYADVAGTSPVDGTGGSPVSAVSSYSSAAIRGSKCLRFLKVTGASRQGEGVAYALTLDGADAGGAVQVSAQYRLLSGTYVDGDMVAFIYDVTNAALIGAGIPLLAAGGLLQWQFVAPASSTSYRLIIHVAGTATVEWQMLVGSVHVGPAQAPAVFVEASSGSGQVVTASTENVDFEDVVSDSWGAWSGSEFTAPVSGLYCFQSIIRRNNAVSFRVGLYALGAIRQYGDASDETSNASASISAIIPLQKGETASLRLNDTITRSTNADLNRIMIARVGDA